MWWNLMPNDQSTMAESAQLPQWADGAPCPATLRLQKAEIVASKKNQDFKMEPVLARKGHANAREGVNKNKRN